MISVLLVEDHELFRMGLHMVLDKADGINLVAEASDGIEGVKMAREYSPDVILMDIGLPNMDGIESTARIKEFLPDVKILILTSRNMEQDILGAFAAGADGYVMKGANSEQTISAIKTVYNGESWIDPAIAKIVISNINRTPQTGYTTENQTVKVQNIYGLTARELDVLELMVEGLSNPQISDKLVISRATAKAHVHSILQKLSTATRTQATFKAMKEGLV